MNLWKYIFAMTVTSGLFLVACSDSTANPITTSRFFADEEGVEKDSNAKSSSSVKKESKDSKSSSSKAKSSSSVKKESEDSKSSSSMSAIESSESSSSDDKAPSSSSSLAQGEDSGDWGTCATTEAFIEKGETVDWKFTTNKAAFTPQDVMVSSFEWTFEGGNPATKSDSGVAGVNAKGIAYEVSGVFAASVKITRKNGETGVVNCSPVDVTGARITECSCTAERDVVDISGGATKTAVWTVSGCKSADDNFTYEWSDNLGNAAMVGAIVTQKGSFAPTVKVRNGDNGLMQVTCDEVKAVDSNNPDYIIKESLNAGAIKLPAGKTAVFLEVDAFNNMVFCNVDPTEASGGVLKGTVNGIAFTGSYFVTATVPGITSGSMLNFELDVPATCGVQ